MRRREERRGGVARAKNERHGDAKRDRSTVSSFHTLSHQLSWQECVWNEEIEAHITSFTFIYWITLTFKWNTNMGWVSCILQEKKWRFRSDLFGIFSALNILINVLTLKIMRKSPLATRIWRMTRWKMSCSSNRRGKQHFQWPNQLWVI